MSITGKDGSPKVPHSTRLIEPQRLVLAGVGFLAFETTLMWILGGKIYDYSYFSPAFWGMLALAGVGYFGLGFFSRSWLSGFALMVPILVAICLVNVVWTTEFENGISVGVNTNLPEVWLTLSVIFVPAWALGVWVFRNRD